MKNWRKPRRHEMPEDGTRVSVAATALTPLAYGALLHVHDATIVDLPLLVCGVVHYIKPDFLVFDGQTTGHDPRGNLAVIYPDGEGITWCRDWRGPAVDALLAVLSL